jgi:hypothetical protein
MIASGIALLMMSAMMYAFLFCARSFVALGNYMDLDKASQFTLDKMSRDIRQVRSLQSFATNQLVFVDFNSNQLTYAWSSTTKKLSRISGGTTNVLLNNCDYLLFDISQRTPTNGIFGFYPATTNPAVCKLVDVSWRCSRTIFGQKVNTESVQTAKIVMRN